MNSFCARRHIPAAIVPTPDAERRRLVLRVNELYHDAENAAYADMHPEIFVAEQRRWARLLRAYLPQGKRLRCLDVGAGTGFVGRQLLPLLSDGSELICADISQAMLALCARDLPGLRPGITVSTLKLGDERLPLEDASVDVVLLNSVLHHVPDAELLLAEIARVLRPGGLVFVGHEPNRRFYTHPVLVRQFKLFRALSPRRIAGKILAVMGVIKPGVARPDPVCDAVNRGLIAEGLVQAPLTRHDISALVDIHSPTAGGEHPDRGFNPWDLAPKGMALTHVETYGHLSKVARGSRILRVYERLLAQIFPRDGATFFLVARRG